MRAVVSIMVLSALAFADSATQTNWSSGPGEPGPLTEWSVSFFTEEGINYQDSGGQITLMESFGMDMCDSGALDFSTADIDGDGDFDLAGISRPANCVYWLENENGDGMEWSFHHIADLDTALYSGIVCGDFDSDGDMDVAATSAYDLTWWENGSSGEVWTWNLVADLQNICGIDCGDVDMDGDIDIVGGITGIDDVCLWLNTGWGSDWVRITIDGNVDQPYSTILVDIDGDMLLDIVSGASWGHCVEWWRNPGDPFSFWTASEIFSGYYCEPMDLGAGDLEGDGDMDVVCASYGDGTYVFSNEDGAGEWWVVHHVDQELIYTHSSVLGDIDGDGDGDVVNINYYGPAVVWWENLDGSGYAWERHVLQIAPGLLRCCNCSDVNGDGLLEIVVANSVHAWIYMPSVPLDSGELVSSTLYVNDADWLGMTWTADAPTGSAVTFQVRASDAYTEMGEWSDTLTVPCSLDGILEDYDSFVQYRAILSRSEPGLSPILYDVTFTWNPLGVSGDHTPGAFELATVSNPAHGEASIRLGMPVAGTADLTVYDLAGRRVSTRSGMEFDAGWNEVALGEFPPGVYFVIASSGGSQASKSLVVVE